MANLSAPAAPLDGGIDRKPNAAIRIIEGSIYITVISSFTGLNLSFK
jgi:hypothetical protein